MVKQEDADFILAHSIPVWWACPECGHDLEECPITTALTCINSECDNVDGVIE